MSEFFTGYVLIITFSVLIFRLLEKTEWLGRKELPRRDGFLVFYAMVGGGCIYQVINLIQYNLALPSEPVGLGLQNIVPIILLSISSVILLSNALVNPSKNFLIAFVVAGATTILCSIFLLLVIDFSQIIGSVPELIAVGLSMLAGLLSGGLVYLILYHIYPYGRAQLWTLRQYWKIINDTRLLLLLIIFVGIETYLQMKFLSILTIFL
ncbi:MAG: hypothetical protein ACTSYB_05115 [Candidatus Helarchaeota archaeon]